MYYYYKTCSSSTAPPLASQGSSAETLYPELPRETNYQEIYHENPTVNEAVKTMIKMGFSNQSGLLTYLLGVEDGNIDNVLEILQPTNKWIWSLTFNEIYHYITIAYDI